MSSGVDGLEALRQLLVFASHRGAHPTLSVRWRLSRLTCPFCAYVEEEAAEKSSSSSNAAAEALDALLASAAALTYFPVNANDAPYD